VGQKYNVRTYYIGWPSYVHDLRLYVKDIVKFGSSLTTFSSEGHFVLSAVFLRGKASAHGFRVGCPKEQNMPQGYKGIYIQKLSTLDLTTDTEYVANPTELCVMFVECCLLLSVSECLFVGCFWSHCGTMPDKPGTSSTRTLPGIYLHSISQSVLSESCLKALSITLLWILSKKPIFTNCNVCYFVFGRPFVKRFALCCRTVVCLSVCPRGQTVGWIKMPLGREVGRGRDVWYILIVYFRMNGEIV